MNPVHNTIYYVLDVRGHQGGSSFGHAEAHETFVLFLLVRLTAVGRLEYLFQVLSCSKESLRVQMLVVQCHLLALLRLQVLLGLLGKRVLV